MNEFSNPGVARLQQQLRSSKATSAVSQAMLDDPHHDALKREALRLRDKFLREGDTAEANAAGAVYGNLVEKELALRAAQAETADAEIVARSVIAKVLDDP